MAASTPKNSLKYVNPFHAAGLFLHPLKISESLWLVKHSLILNLERCCNGLTFMTEVPIL